MGRSDFLSRLNAGPTALDPCLSVPGGPPPFFLSGRWCFGPIFAKELHRRAADSIGLGVSVGLSQAHGVWVFAKSQRWWMDVIQQALQLRQDR